MVSNSLKGRGLGSFFVFWGMVLEIGKCVNFCKVGC